MTTKPTFRPGPQVSALALNQVAEAAFGTVTFEGGEVINEGPNVHIAPPPPHEWLYGRVTRAVGPHGCAGYGSDAYGKDADPGPPAYSWVEVYRDPCRGWTPSGRTGDGSTQPAYEANGNDVEDGTVWKLHAGPAWLDASVNPPRQVQEWLFWAGAAGRLPEFPGIGSGSEGSGPSVNPCPGGMQVGQSVTFEHTTCVGGQPCKTVTTIDFPQPVRVCVQTPDCEPQGSQG